MKLQDNFILYHLVKAACLLLSAVLGYWCSRRPSPPHQILVDSVDFYPNNQRSVILFFFLSSSLYKLMCATYGREQNCTIKIMQCYVLYITIFVERTPACFTELEGCLALRCRSVTWLCSERKPVAEAFLTECSNWVCGIGGCLWCCSCVLSHRV